MKQKFLLVATLAVSALLFTACRIDYMVQIAPGESGTFEKITDESVETLVPPADNYKVGSSSIITWRLAQRFDISKDGNIAYLAIRDRNTNIFVQNIKQRGASNQRTNRMAVNDVAYSPNGENICFSEPNLDGTSYLYITNARQGSVVQQISPANACDRQPSYSKDGKHIFFSRFVGNGASIWSYEIATGNFTMHCNGTNPVPINNEEFLYSQKNQFGRNEIWLHNFVKGFDTRIVNEVGRSFTTGSVSPDGKWLLFVSTQGSKAKVKDNLDIYYMRADGTGGATQLTFHEGHDCSPVWSPDGKYIYFLSQRGTERGAFNIWRVDFKAQENLIDDQYEYTPQRQQEPQKEEKTNMKLPRRRNN